jgi:hypothetical protein
MKRLSFLALTVLSLATAMPASAGSMLEGTWSGSGIVKRSSGQPEPVTCKVKYRQTSATVHAVAAVCSTSSLKFRQTGELTTVREGSYVGEFENAEYQIEGRIRVVIKSGGGNAQSVTFSSDAGVGTLVLTRL